MRQEPCAQRRHGRAILDDGAPEKRKYEPRAQARGARPSARPARPRRALERGQRTQVRGSPRTPSATRSCSRSGMATRRMHVPAQRGDYCRYAGLAALRVEARKREIAGPVPGGDAAQRRRVSSRRRERPRTGARAAARARPSTPRRRKSKPAARGRPSTPRRRKSKPAAKQMGRLTRDRWTRPDDAKGVLVSIAAATGPRPRATRPSRRGRAGSAAPLG